jgi:hypothetical protein
MLRRAITKRQQGLALTEVPLTLEDGIVMMKLMLTLADELAPAPKGDDDHTGEQA